MDVPNSAKAFVVTFAGFLALTITSMSVWLWFQSRDGFDSNKDAFQLIVTQTLLPLFTAVASAVLAYIFARTAFSAVEVYAESRKAKP
jgi:cytochrome c biogenesis factor